MFSMFVFIYSYVFVGLLFLVLCHLTGLFAYNLHCLPQTWLKMSWNTYTTFRYGSIVRAQSAGVTPPT